MYILVNIILHIGMNSIPQVHVITNFNSLEICEAKFDEIFSLVPLLQSSYSYKKMELKLCFILEFY